MNPTEASPMRTRQHLLVVGWVVKLFPQLLWCSARMCKEFIMTTTTTTTTTAAQAETRVPNKHHNDKFFENAAESWNLRLSSFDSRQFVPLRSWSRISSSGSDWNSIGQSVGIYGNKDVYSHTYKYIYIDTKSRICIHASNTFDPLLPFLYLICWV